MVVWIVDVRGRKGVGIKFLRKVLIMLIDRMDFIDVEGWDGLWEVKEGMEEKIFDWEIVVDGEKVKGEESG